MVHRSYRCLALILAVGMLVVSCALPALPASPPVPSGTATPVPTPIPAFTVAVSPTTIAAATIAPPPLRRLQWRPVRHLRR